MVALKKALYFKPLEWAHSWGICCRLSCDILAFCFFSKRYLQLCSFFGGAVERFWIGVDVCWCMVIYGVVILWQLMQAGKWAIPVQRCTVSIQPTKSKISTALYWICNKKCLHILRVHLYIINIAPNILFPTRERYSLFPSAGNRGMVRIPGGFVKHAWCRAYRTPRRAFVWTPCAAVLPIHFWGRVFHISCPFFGLPSSPCTPPEN